VLIVEDDAPIREMIADELAHKGFIRASLLIKHGPAPTRCRKSRRHVLT
jgi:hypothetical protein